ncbi:site-2 protease family protein [Patescibacteria group bacterium]|nr:site-2 protease family protein [Patescibacteria group bacterium]MBU4078002.1 site-2 protease family protein [Patescibacteria group bacterium]
MLLAIIVFLLIFSFLIISHELGHLIAAKKAGVEVEEFGIGYPPRIWGKKFKGTIYSINWIPFGGFVKIYGEDLGEDTVKDKKSFYNKPPRVKAMILVSGVLVNILVAILLFYCFLGFNGFESFQSQLFDYEFPFGEQENHIVVSSISDQSPAQEVGLEPYDLILSLNGKEVDDANNFISLIKERQGEEVILSLENLKTKESREVIVIPRENPPENEGALGAGIAVVSRLSYKGSGKIFSGITHTANLSHLSFSVLGYLIKTSVQEKDISYVSQSVAGPVGILAFTKLTMAGGFWQIINLVAIISLALGIMNILPIPAADGGRLMFVLYEVVFNKQAPPKLERMINLIGFYLLLALLFLVTYKDIVQFKDILF